MTARRLRHWWVFPLGAAVVTQWCARDLNPSLLVWCSAFALLSVVPALLWCFWLSEVTGS